MTEVPLLVGYTEGTMQWRAESLQMINWGGFHGHHPIDFAAGATLISGASGTGKSTLLDAYIALMMPSTVPFNGASNDATTGRARGVDQRNILTYLRGKRDSALDRVSGTLTDQVLRGDGEQVWGAVSMTFVDDSGRQFTAMRVYFAPVGAQRPADVLSRMFTLNGPFDLRDLSDFADSRFDPRAIRARFSGLSYHDAPTKFSDTVATRLGIGANGDGDKALRLLARIQVGHQVKTVDSLYKQMVLEVPATYDAADRAVGQFQSLDQSYRDLETDGDKERALQRTAALHDDYERSRSRADQLDRFGVAREGVTPLRLWELRTEKRLLEAGERQNKQDRDDAKTGLNRAEGKVTKLNSDLKNIEDLRRANGGGTLDSLTAKLDEANSKRAKVSHARTRFEVRTQVLGLSCPDEATFDEVRIAAAEFGASADEREQTLTTQRDAHVSAIPELTKHQAALIEEHKSLKTRDGQVPVGQDKARNQIAQACGLRPQDLPFAAELMDVDPDHENWRLAAEVTLGGIGLTMLMDERRQKHIRETIDGLHLDQRIHFEGVDLGSHAASPSDPRYISGRLVFKDSPFTPWVKSRVTQPGTDHLCVDHPSQLGGSDPKVTVNGQVSRGRRGAHGWNRDQRWVLGFSNESRLREIESEVLALRGQIAGHETGKKTLDGQLGVLRAKAEAYRAVIATDWETLDVAGVNAEIADLERQKTLVLRNSGVLAALQAQQERVEGQLEGARAERVRLKDTTQELADEWGRIVDRQDEVTRERDEVERAGTTILPDDDEQDLSAAFDALEEDVDYRRFGAACGRFRHELKEESSRERKSANRTAETLTGIFEQYNERWPDPNRGHTIDSYPEFAAIYDDIVKHGLFERRQAFKRQFQKWSGDDLKLLNDAYDLAITDIEERLDPVNEILSSLPFGAQQDRLRIVPRRLHPEPLVAFRKQLRTLTSNVAVDWTDEQTEDRFRQLRDFMKLLRKPEQGAVGQRDDLLDVRRHIEITASRMNADGDEISTYSALGGKSGGESQELVAFIVGAALRYQLGDETRTRPRFAPVFLDEGFVKSDSEFAGRAVRAWRGLGFQLIIGAPLDKVTALEPHMDLILSVTKRQDTGYAYVTPFRDAPALARPTATREAS